MALRCAMEHGMARRSTAQHHRAYASERNPAPLNSTTQSQGAVERGKAEHRAALQSACERAESFILFLEWHHSIAGCHGAWRCGAPCNIAARVCQQAESCTLFIDWHHGTAGHHGAWQGEAPRRSVNVSERGLTPYFFSGATIAARM